MPDAGDNEDSRAGPAGGSSPNDTGERGLVRPARPVADLVVRSLHHPVVHAVLVAAAGAAVVAVLTWLSAGVYAGVKDAAGLASLDEPALEWAISVRNPTTVGAVNVFTQLGGPIGMTVITAAIVLVMSLSWRSWTPLVLIGIGVAGSLLLTVVGKNLVGRARPPLSAAIPPYESSWSFPSGHALNGTVIASLVAYLILLHLTSWIAKVITVLLAVCWFVAMGLSRVFLGHHWLTDVIVGWTLGLAWVAVVITAHRLFLAARPPSLRHS